MSLVSNFEETLRYELEMVRKVPLRKKNLVLGVPKAPAEFGLTSVKNTAITAEFEERAFLVTYDRQTLATYFGSTFTVARQGLRILAPSVKTTHDLLGDINREFDLALRPEDVVDAPLVLEFSTTQVAITMTPECLWFIGSFNFPLIGKYQQVGDSLLVGVDSDLLIGKDTTSGVSAILVRAGQKTHHIDYSPGTSTFRGVPWSNSYTWTNTPTPVVSNLVIALNNIDGLGWVYSTSYGVKNNLLNGHVAYNGPIEGFELKIPSNIANQETNLYSERFPMCRQDLSHVLVYQPNPNSGASNLSSYPMFIHYGDPVPKEHYEQPDTPPVHWWKLQEDVLNYGTSPEALPFAPPVDFFDDQFGKGAQLKATGVFPLGLSWDTDRDFTVAFEFCRQDILQEYQGLFGDSTGTAPIGALVMGTTGRFYLAARVLAWDTGLAGCVNRHRCEVMICKRGKRYLIYVNGKCVDESLFAVDQVLAPWTHFGKVNHFLKTTTRFANIKLFDYCLNRDQVSRHYRGLF